MAIIKIKLMSDLCAGNGESIGYGVDSDICSDQYGFPYIPGKRLMGCLRESMCRLKEYGLSEATQDKIDLIFGNGNGKEGNLILGNAVLNGIEHLHHYVKSLRGNAKERTFLVAQSTHEKIIRRFTSVRGQTKISKDGIAQGGSLRFIRVLNQYDPVSGEKMIFCCKADVSRLNQEEKELLRKACMTLRHIGSDRNRGLGNVSVEVDFTSDKDNSSVNFSDNSNKTQGDIIISYQAEFNSPITVQEYLEDGSQIKARTIIGLFAREYIKKFNVVDEKFNNLFLDGTVKWSALTPVINGLYSDSVPLIFRKLKNDNGRMINIFTSTDSEWKKKKPKSLDGSYAAVDKEGNVFIAQPETQVIYHNRLSEESTNTDKEKKGLYIQKALGQGMIYGGHIILPASLKECVKDLLSGGVFYIGRSKKVQYGTISINTAEVDDFNYDSDDKNDVLSVESDNEPVFAILKSDLVLQEDAQIRLDQAFVRKKIAEKTGLKDIKPDKYEDLCGYHVLSGFHSMWQMQKPKIQAIMGGSVYCFIGKKEKYRKKIFLGEYLQEGLGQIELYTLSDMMKYNNIEEGKITSMKHQYDSEVIKKFENQLIFDAALEELHKCAFIFKKADEKKPDRDRILKNVPVGRMRQILNDANNPEDLLDMIESMKVSDVSSESKGKKYASKDLVRELYGLDNNPKNKRVDIELEKIIKDKDLLNELKNNKEVTDRIIKLWKEPLTTLLHMLHYQKSRR